jgi:hypothetical protein
MSTTARGSSVRRPDGQSHHGRGGRPLPHPERGPASRHVAIRMWPDEVQVLTQLGNGSIAEGFHALVLLHITQADHESYVGGRFLTSNESISRVSTG